MGFFGFPEEELARLISRLKSAPIHRPDKRRRETQEDIAHWNKVDKERGRKKAAKKHKQHMRRMGK
jgi:hypothetical protein